MHIVIHGSGHRDMLLLDAILIVRMLSPTVVKLNSLYDLFIGRALFLGKHVELVIENVVDLSFA
jgi:hypothetical protein